jgi:hypothetical protein
MSILTSGKNIILEKYLANSSDSKDFKIIESELAKIIKMVKQNFPPLYNSLTNVEDRKKLVLTSKINPATISSSDSNRVIEKQFAKIFNLKGFKLVWTKVLGPNAVTPIRTYTILDNNSIVQKIKNKNSTTNISEKDNSNLFIGTIVDLGLIMYCDLNEQELLAIILHEIGHNFYTSVLHILSRLPVSISNLQSNFPQTLFTTMVTFGILDITNFHELFVKSADKIQNFLYKNMPGLGHLFDLFQTITYNIGFLSNLHDMNNFIKNLPDYLNGTFSTKYFFGYSEEKFADNFASNYGYGPALAAGLNKLDQQKENLIVKATSEVPCLNWLVDLLRLQSDIVSLCVSDHPRTQNRIRSCLDKLKREVNDPALTPEVKQQLQQQIKEYEDWYYNYYLKLSENQNQSRIFSWLYRVGCEKIFGGKLDIRELIYRLDDLQF